MKHKNVDSVLQQAAFNDGEKTKLKNFNG